MLSIVMHEQECESAPQCLQRSPCKQSNIVITMSPHIVNSSCTYCIARITAQSLQTSEKCSLNEPVLRAENYRDLAPPGRDKTGSEPTDSYDQTCQ